MSIEKHKRTRRIPSIFGTGLLALDIVINGDGLEKPKFYAGGTCGNVLSILSYMGWQAYPVARLNGDIASKHVIKDLKRWGVNLKFTSCKPLCNTPLIIQKISQDKSSQGKPHFHFHCPKCGAWYPSYRAVHASTIKEIATKIHPPNIFFFDRVSRGALILAKACAEKGALVVFEPSGIGNPKLFKEALGLIHILKYSNERIEGICDISTADTRLLLEIQTQGHKGLRFRNLLASRTKEQWQHIDAFEIPKVIDTAGCGDWCTAGILNMLGRNGFRGFEKSTNDKLIKALLYGQAAAAWNCGFEGARGGMDVIDIKEFKADIRNIMQGKTPKNIVINGQAKSLKKAFLKLCPVCGRE